jgi:hypothetical protein
MAVSVELMVVLLEGPACARARGRNLDQVTLDARNSSEFERLRTKGREAMLLN